MGLCASDGIAQYEPIFMAPGIRPAEQKSFMRLIDKPHFSDVCLIDK